MDDTGVITIKKTHIHKNIPTLQKTGSGGTFSSLPDIQIGTVDSNPDNMIQNDIKTNGAIAHTDDIDTFNFTYYGNTTIDKRTIPSVFPWIAKRILKNTCSSSKDVYANISNSKLWLTERNKTDVNFQEHPFDSIYRLSRMNKHHMDEYLAYLICSESSGPNAVFHLLKCNDQNEKHIFLNTLKTKVLGFQKAPQSKKALSQTMTPPRPTHKRGVSSGAILVSPVKKDSSFCDSIYYVGKVNLQQPKAPPQFIDKVLVHLKLTKNDLPSSKINLMKKRLSLDEREPHPAEIILKQPKPKKPLTRKRSASVDSDKYNPHQVNLKNPPEIDMSSFKNNAADIEDETDGPSVSLNNINEEVKSRLITMELSKHSLCLYSMGTKNLLFQKKIQNISFCTKGDSKKDHFAFICREAGNHICYIFQGQSEEKVDDIMSAMRIAFTEALQASADSTLCDMCPIQNLHKLCNNLEGANSISEKEGMIHETIKVLSDYEQLHVLNEVNEQDSESDNERIEITVNVLRELFDTKQASHKHSHKIQQTMEEHKDKFNLSSSANSTLFGKAKKSLASSLQNFSMKKPQHFAKVNQSRQRDGDELKPRSRSLEASDAQEFGQNSTPRLELDLEGNEGTQKKPNKRTSSIEEVEKKVPDSVSEEKEDEFQPVTKQKPDFNKNCSLARQQSWRQAIFHSVVVNNTRRTSTSSTVTLTGENDEINAIEQNIDIGARARSRWRNAIHNQILLIRMEKENKKLAANISASEIRRQKLSYQDLSTFTEEAATAWDDIILHKSNEKIEKQHLLELVRGGIPRARRGEIWQFLVKQYMMAKPDTSERQSWKATPYRTLLKKNSGHQHAILIDLGRTFPTHVHFIPRLGSGQISLFNILTAYSQLDDEVGYCQGLSFVAGVLLMHMSEEDAFKSFCHLMFELQIRNQYKPDMNAVQQQLYQLSRLLHDYHPKVYEHFNKYDVTPTLYAAPWFLTLYASQYPIGFVSRVMDMVLLEGLDIIFKIALVLIGNHADEILERDSFETIVDYMKLDLPTKVVTETDNICKRALNMDINHQLNLYEVEYQLLNEEMIDIRQSKEKYEKQEVALEEVNRQMSEVKKELKNAQTSVKYLQSALHEANRKNQEYELKLKQLSKENESLRTGSHTQVKMPITDSDLGNWDLLPSPPTLQREMLKCNMGRAMSLDSGSLSFLSSEENISCEMDL